MKYSSIGIKHNGYEQILDNYFPLHDGILVKLPEIKDVTDSGIIVSELTKQNAKSVTEDDLGYEVVKVGPECVNVQPGDFVLMGQNRGYPVYLKEGNETKEYAQLFQNWIIGVFRTGAKEEDFVPTEGKVEVNNKKLKGI